MTSYTTYDIIKNGNVVIGGDIVYSVLPCLWAECVVKLYQCSVGTLVGDALLVGFALPSLWETIFLVLA